MDPHALLLYRRNKWARRYFYFSRIQIRPRRTPFDLNNYEDDNCLKLFRFQNTHIKELRRLLRIPFSFACRNGTFCSGEEGLCILLRRLTYPNRLFDLTLLFQRSMSDICQIVNHLLDHIIRTFGHLLTDFNQPWLGVANIRSFVLAIAGKGVPLRNCWGFVDGTLRPICRPVRFQRQVYNGHKRVHGIKYQSIIAPNGIIANMFGPIEGRRHDSFMLAESGILPALQQLALGQGQHVCIYGDPAYPLRPQLIGPYKGARLTPQQMEFNKRMSGVRVSVEWGFGKILQLFAFVDFKKNQKLFLQPIAKHFKVATILTNCHTCYYGSQTGSFFELNPPKIDEYLV